MHHNHFTDALADAFLLFCISMANWAALEQGLRILSLVIACLVGGYRLVAIIRSILKKRRQYPKANS